MESTQASSQEEPPVPLNFKTIREIDDLPNEKIRGGCLVNVIGFIKDFQKPKQSRGTDFKCTLEIIDHSIQHKASGMGFSVFWPEEHMPVVPDSKSIVIIRNCKVQMRSGTVSLIANKFSTEIHIISKSKIGQNPSIISPDWKVFGILRGRNPPIPPTSSEVLFAIWLNRQPEFTALPSEMEFQMRSMQSINSRDKFSLLRDVKADCFYDILGEVIKIIDQGPETVTIYLSDYTANSNFYQNVWGDSVEDGEGRDGDQYGYVKPKKKSIEDWPGPFGKLSIQLSIFDTHANFIRDSVKPGDWVLLCNVQMKFGRTGGLLEGFLRGDRGSYEGKIQVRLMLKSTNSEDYDPRWKEALRRKHEWSKKFNAQKEEFLNEALGKAKKRKYDEAPKPNSRGRRKKARKQGVTTSDAKLTQNSSLNQNIRCNFPEKPTIHIQDILKPEIFVTAEDGQQFASPFTVRKYRTNVRIIDYYPDRIEDFAVGRRASEMDILSDYSGGEDTDLEEDRRLWNEGKGFAKDVWEWRFELLVEDADPVINKGQLWLSVDNKAAQGLLDLDSKATSLRQNSNLLAKLKEQLFKLWGDLEEQKSAYLNKHRTNVEAKKANPTTPFSTLLSSPPQKAGTQPDPDSDIENEQAKPTSKKEGTASILSEHETNTLTLQEEGKCPTTKILASNKAFTCCIKQYGVLIHEDDPEKANAGNGKRWQRKFGLFDTFII